jgi:hypothetical protein
VEEARAAVKEKNVGWELWTDESVKEKENKALGPGRGGGGYTITRLIDGVAEEEIANQSVATGIWATSFTAEAKAATTAATLVMKLIEQYVAEHGNKDTHAVIFVSDSLLLAQALQGDP